ncbi:hypothetical protein BCR39DRAFT_549698 [Naematelia encephala]|uniref:Uncharacterized protein n=1 Tax=Naematelia encephala TaxID=71784 RepID=A0A1Y2AKW7_9TREE|nr:hypothetical protein BCR39DRAFT_549698 [Naematelia encephala]
MSVNPGAGAETLGTSGAGAGSTGVTGGTTGTTQTGGQMDALDKGIDGLLKKSGHSQSRATTEKISDGIRSIFKKVTGKDVPIKDQN